jgi:acyl-CoA synthetase (NDP forming)
VFASCARILLEDEHIGGLLLVGLFGGYGLRFAEKLKFIEEDAAHRMGKLVKELGKPIVVHSLYNFAKPHSHELLRYYGIPVYDSVDIACKCMAVLSHYGQYLGTYHSRTNFVLSWGAKAKKEGKRIIRGALGEGRHSLLEHESMALLRMHGAPAPETAIARSAEEAAKLAKGIERGVALKIVSPDILHKSEAGGVKLHLKTEKDVRQAFKEIMQGAAKHKKDADLRGCLVSPMADEGLEVIIGTKIDEQFGPVIMFGLGGILVEVVRDVSFRVLPISRRSARKMMSDIKASHVLGGIRGNPPVDKNALCCLLLAVAEIVEAYPEIREMDLNPVIAHEHGAAIVDARIILKK